MSSDLDAAVWQRVFEQAPVGMWLSEPGIDARVLVVNDALCRLTGLSREQLLTLPKAEIFRGAVEVDGTEEGLRTYELHLELPDGTVRWVHATARPLDHLTLAHFVDVTATKVATERQTAVLALIPDPVHIADATDGRHLWTTKQLGHELGWSDEHLAELDAEGRMLVHDADLGVLTTSIADVRAAADGEVVHVRHRAPAADGGVRWIDRRSTPFRRDADGAVVELLSVTRDVTEEVLASADLKRAVAFQEALLTAAPDIISVYDLVRRRSVWASGSLEEQLGYDLAAVQQHQAQGLQGIVHPDDIAGFYDDMHRVGQVGDGEVVTGRARVRHTDGTWKVFARRCMPFRRDSTGRVFQSLNVVWDVTEQAAAEAELAEVQSFQAAIIAASPDMIALLDAVTGRPVWTSRHAGDLLGFDDARLKELGDRPFDQLAHPDDLPGLRAAEAAVIAQTTSDVVHARYRAIHSDGTWRWISRRMLPFKRDADGTVQQLLVVARDVSDVVAAQHNLEHAALHDALTGLPNRRLVADRLRAALATRSRDSTQLAVLFLDLDGFKRVNDAHGHLAGDIVLQAVSDRISRALRPGDTVGRMGGDEFVVILTPVEGEDVQELTRRVGLRLRTVVAQAVRHEGLSHTVTASIGVAYASGGDDADVILRDADTAMYRAKSGGKDRLSVFDPEQHAEAVDRAQVEQLLRDALAQDTIEVHYQPIVRSCDGRLDGVEALMRVPSPSGGWLDAQHAVTVAEQTGLISAIGARLLEKACAQAVAWDADLELCVNLSAHEIAKPQLYDRVRAALDTAGLAPGRLTLELTESVLLEAARSTVADLERLRADGVGISIDDFGTGYASLRYLATLPVSAVKIDRTFTSGLGVDPVSDTLVRATIGLARDLGLTCVVEGIESPTQLEAIGTDAHVRAQGYFLGRPGAPGERPEQLLS